MSSCYCYFLFRTKTKPLSLKGDPYLCILQILLKKKRKHRPTVWMLQMPFAVHTVCYMWTQLMGMARNPLSELGQKDRHHSSWPAVKPTKCNIQDTAGKLKCCHKSVVIYQRSSCQSTVKATHCNMDNITTQFVTRKQHSAKCASKFSVGTLSH